MFWRPFGIARFTGRRLPRRELRRIVVFNDAGQSLRVRLSRQRERGDRRRQKE
jgi:hypothetical protein